MKNELEIKEQIDEMMPKGGMDEKIWCYFDGYCRALKWVLESYK